MLFDRSRKKKFSVVIQWKLLSETEENKSKCMLSEYQISVVLLLFKNIKVRS